MAPIGSLDAGEVKAFEALAGAWWDPDGPHGPLHKLNPTRLAYVRDRLAPLSGGARSRPLKGLRVVDVGCGGGLVSEPLARLGAAVTGIDAGERAIAVARRHAEASDLAIDYRCQTVEDLAATGAIFDALVALEIVEHVADLDGFLTACAALVRPGGRVVVSTLNRTVKAFGLGIVAAERVLGWVEPGTHDWRRFVKPAELARHLRRHGARVIDVTGIVYDVAYDEWRASADTAVNYMATAIRD
jgi:2-polyprenyl-6-hydroxyphenyl methylase/3-demethylubiquinone-9 3-methyltransferase